MREIDLHVHTTASDGATSPEETVRLAAEKGLRAIAVTDHDTTAGLAAALAAGVRYGVEVVPGIECSAEYCGREVHILGYYIDPACTELQSALQAMVADRLVQNRRIIEKLAAAGFDISEQAVLAQYPDTVIGRPHIAEYLVQKGYGPSVFEVFHTYLNHGQPYYVPRKHMPYAEVIRLLKAAGGVPVLAHAFLNVPDGGTVEKMAADMAAAGIVGLETIYSTFTPAQEGELRRLADRYGLLITGGSDFHGSRKSDIDLGSGRGHLRVPYTLLAELKKAAGK